MSIATTVRISARIVLPMEYWCTALMALNIRTTDQTVLMTVMQVMKIASS